MSGAAARTGKLRKKGKKNIIEKAYEGACLKVKTITYQPEKQKKEVYKNILGEIEGVCIIILYRK